MPEDKDPKMLEGKENNPERLLPKGNLSLGVTILILFLINAVVFGLVVGISVLLLSQHIDGALMIAEVVVAITLVVSIVWVIVKRKK